MLSYTARPKGRPHAANVSGTGAARGRGVIGVRRQQRRGGHAGAAHRLHPAGQLLRQPVRLRDLCGGGGVGAAPRFAINGNRSVRYPALTGKTKLSSWPPV